MLTVRAICNSTDVQVLCSFDLEGSMRKALRVETFRILILFTNWTL